jgi:hypothetical protein
MKIFRHKSRNNMRTVLCSATPDNLNITGVFSLSPRVIGEEVSLRLADAKWTFLAFATVTNIRSDNKFTGAYRYDLKVINK